MKAKNKPAAGQPDNYIFEYYDAITRIKNGEKVKGVRAAGVFVHAIFKILTDGINSGEYLFDKKKHKRQSSSLKTFVTTLKGVPIFLNWNYGKRQSYQPYSELWIQKIRTADSFAKFF